LKQWFFVCAKVLTLIVDRLDKFYFVKKRINITKLGVYFSNPEPEGYPFDKRGYRDSYFDLAKRLSQKGIEMIVVRGKKSYLGSGVFAGGWKFQSAKTLKYLQGPLKVDSIFNRGQGKNIFSKERDVIMLNHPKLDAICTNKWLTYENFQDLSPLTFLVDSLDELKVALKKIPGRIAFTKPIDGEDCANVFAGTKKELLAKADRYYYPRIIQESIDTRGGLPGVCKVRHDLRVFVVNGKPQYSDIRLIHDLNSRIADVGLSSKIDRKEVSLKELPLEVFSLVAEIDSKLKKYSPRAYAVDIGWDVKENKPKVIELNARVGLPQLAYSWYDQALSAYVDFLQCGMSIRKN
jgi:hypothetical protein